MITITCLLCSFYPLGNCRAYNEGKVCPFKHQGNSGGKAAPAQLTSKQQKADKKAEKAKVKLKKPKSKRNGKSKRKRSEPNPRAPTRRRWTFKAAFTHKTDLRRWDSI